MLKNSTLANHKSQHRMVLLVLVFHFASFLKAQNTLEQQKFSTVDYHNETLFVEKEVGNAAITGVKHSSDGTLLLSTNIGFLSYGGSHFIKYFSKSISEEIKGLVYDFDFGIDGSLWMLSSKYLMWTDGVKFDKYITNSKSVNYNHLIIDKNGMPWFVLDGELNRLVDDNIQPVKIAKNVQAIVVDNDTNILVAYANKIIKINLLGDIVSAPLILSKKGGHIEMIFKTRADVLLVAKKSGLYQLKNGSYSKVEFPEENVIFHSIFEDSNQNIWIGTDKSIYQFSNDKMSLVNFKQSNSFRVRGIQEDAFGNIWFGSWGEGLNRLKSPVLELFDSTINNGKGFFVNSDNSNWYNLYNRNVWYKKGKNNYAIEQPKLPNNDSIYYLEGANNEMWIGYSHQVVQYDSKGSIIKEYANFSGNSNLSAIIDDQKNIWVIFDYKLYFKSIDDNQNFNEFQHLQEKKLFNLIKMGNEILIQSKEESFVYDGHKLYKNNDIEALQREKNFAMFYSEEDKQLWYMNFEDNLLVKHEKDVKYEYILDKKVADFSVYKIYKDSNKNIFLLGENGIIRIRQKWIDQYKNDDNESLFFELMISPIANKLECNSGKDSISSDSQGNVYFTCHGGVLRYQANSDISDTELHPVPRIDKITIGGLNITNTEKNEFKPSTELYNFIFSSIHLDNTLPFDYRYRLQGINSDWKYTHKDFSSSYVSLKPGSYTFEVQVRNTNSKWMSSQQASFSFIVLPYFYEKLWFILLSLSFLLSALYLIISLWTSKLRASQKKLALLVERRTYSLKALQKRELDIEKQSQKELSKQVLIRTRELREQMDLTLEKERQLRQSQKMEMVGHLTSGIAHDFNNILSVIFMGTDILKHNMDKNTANNEESRIWLEKTIKASKNGKEIIAQLLQFTKVDRKNQQILNVIDILNDSFSLVEIALPETMELKINTIDELTSIAIDIDKAKFNQIVLNLIINAKQACNNHGKIEINTKVSRYKNTCTSCHESFGGQYVCMSIKDDGHGIDENSIQEIFQPFYTTKAEQNSYGIGLQIVHNNLHDIGGHIVVNSLKGKGVAFDLYFPVSREVKGQPIVCVADINKKDNKLDNVQLLLVEDSLSLSKSIKQVLSYQNVFTDIANDGVDGLELFKSNPNKYDIILTDNAMPRMDGLSMIESIQKIDKDIPIILLTGFADDEFLQKSKLLDIKEVVLKPFDSKTLIKLLKKHIKANS